MMLPRLLRYFGMFQVFFGVVRPLWPYVSRLWQRRSGAPAANHLALA